MDYDYQNENIDKIILLGAIDSIYPSCVSELTEIQRDAKFLYLKEAELFNTLTSTYIKVGYVADKFSEIFNEILNGTHPGFVSYLPDLNKERPTISHPMVVELSSFDLAVNFVSFLIFSKSALDKLIPLYSYAYYDNLQKFSNKGADLLKRVEKNKNIVCKEEIQELISVAKKDWIDDLIDLRDKYTHFSSLPEYRGFWIESGKLGSVKIESVKDLNRPAIKVRGVYVDAYDYVNGTKNKLVKFLSDFIALCNFTDGRPPKRYYRCDCGFEFIKKIGTVGTKPILKPVGKYQISIRDRNLNYAVILCPTCGRTTDTNLEMWAELGYKF